MREAAEGAGPRVALSITVVAFAGILLALLWAPGEPAGAPAGAAPAGEVLDPLSETDAAGFAAAGTTARDTEVPLLLTVPPLENLRGAKILTAAGTDEMALTACFSVVDPYRMAST